MALITANNGKATLLAWLLCEDTRTDFKIKLFSNDVQVDAETVLADLTEASFTGYAAKSIARTAFSTPALSGTSATSSLAAQTWTNSGATSTTVYGLYITNADSTVLFWVERFSITATVAAAGTLSYTPTFWFGGCL